MPEQDRKKEVEDAYEAAGSYRQEVQKEVASEIMGDSAESDVHGHGTNGRKESPDTTGANPKRTENSRPN